MIDDDYYIPNIEDLHIGYCCEFYLKLEDIKEGFWINTILQGVDGAVKEYHSKNLYRTPYLTKEKIEKEGWENGEVTANKKGYFFFCRLERNILTITTVGTAACPEEILFKGRCPSINEFRTICKLLKIN